MFAEHNATAAAADGVSRVDRVVRAHIGSNAILDCVVKKGSQFGMVSSRLAGLARSEGLRVSPKEAKRVLVVLVIEGQLVSEKGRRRKKLIGRVCLWEGGWWVRKKS